MSSRSVHIDRRARTLSNLLGGSGRFYEKQNGSHRAHAFLRRHLPPNSPHHVGPKQRAAFEASPISVISEEDLKVALPSFTSSRLILVQILSR